MKLEQQTSKNVLVAPLDWGLGHTTRCIPIIYELIQQKARVVVAGNSVQQELLKKEFPQLEYTSLEGYGVRYATNGSFFLLTMMKQIPGILKAIKNEQNWLRNAVTTHKIDGIISDNRFGLYHKTIPSVFITHQLHIKHAMGAGLEKVTQKMNYRWINKFSECWIPDYEMAPGLAGVLSHPASFPNIPCSYVGPLSRMRNIKKESNGKLLIILSGPEPQRTLFESKIIQQLKGWSCDAVLVRGLPNGGMRLKDLPENIEIYEHLNAAALNKQICAASFIICRSGYSSVMDMHASGRTAIYIPTPGQTEQEYIAEMLQQNNYAVTSTQDQFNLSGLIKTAQLKQPLHPSPENTDQLLNKAVEDFLNRL